MENLLVKITQLYEKHKKSPKTIEKLTYYVEKQLPALLDKYDAQEKRRIYLEKESKRYINSFLSHPEYQYFYIKNTDTFIEYNGCDYKIIPEDNLWFKILNDITEKKTLLEWKQQIKSQIIDALYITESIFNLFLIISLFRSSLPLSSAPNEETFLGS